MRAYALLLLLSVVAVAQTGTAVKYHATINDVKYVYGMAAPVAHVKSGDIIETNTLDAFGNALKKPGDRMSLVKGDNPLTGPFYIDGAQPGGHARRSDPGSAGGWESRRGESVAGFGALNQTTYTAMLHIPLPEKIWFYPIDKATNTATFQALDPNSQ
jgi:amidase